MKTKKKLTIAIICALVAVLTAFTVLRLGSPWHINVIHAHRYDLAENVDALKTVSDLVAVVSIADKGENVIIRDEEDNSVIFGYTKTEAKIVNLFNQNAEFHIGDTITITEECYTTDSETTLWTQRGYLPMSAGSMYLVFLKAYEADSDYAGMYFPVDLEYGKYVIIENLKTEDLAQIKQSRKLLEVGDETDLDEYADWYDEIMREYINGGNIMITENVSDHNINADAYAGQDDRTIL